MNERATRLEAAILRRRLRSSMSRHAYGARKALDDVSFAVAAGDLRRAARPQRRGQEHAVLAHHPALRRRGGSVSVFGHDVARQSGAALARTRRRVPEPHARSRPHRRCRTSSITRPCTASAGARRAPAASALLKRVGLADRAHDNVRELSGGQMRRVEIARALIHRPAPPAARRADRRPRRQGARRHSGADPRPRRHERGRACCGPRI